MTTVEGEIRSGVPVARGHSQPGSAASRLAEASRQIAIVLEGVDLEEEPEFGESLVKALDAVDEAAAREQGRSESASKESSGEMVFGRQR